MIDRYKFGPFVPLPEATSSLLDAALILGKHGLHRVCVVDAGEWALRIAQSWPLPCVLGGEVGGTAVA